MWNRAERCIYRAYLTLLPMPSTDFVLTVPQPCHEDWEQMTPAEQGRICAACNKVVVDFSQKTDAELLLWLSGSPDTCGQFRADQLGRPLQLPPPPPVVPRWQTWLAAAAADAARYGQLLPKPSAPRP